MNSTSLVADYSLSRAASKRKNKKATDNCSCILEPLVVKAPWLQPNGRHSSCICLFRDLESSCWWCYDGNGVCEGHGRAEGDAAVRCLLDGRLIWDMRGLSGVTGRECMWHREWTRKR